MFDYTRPSELHIFGLIVPYSNDVYGSFGPNIFHVFSPIISNGVKELKKKTIGNGREMQWRQGRPHKMQYTVVATKTKSISKQATEMEITHIGRLSNAH